MHKTETDDCSEEIYYVMYGTVTSGSGYILLGMLKYCKLLLGEGYSRFLLQISNFSIKSGKYQVMCLAVTKGCIHHVDENIRIQGATICLSLNSVHGNSSIPVS